MSQSPGKPIFRGLDGTECEEFIAAIQEKAHASQKQRDNDWIVDYVATCLRGNAMRWYADLDDDVQENWKLLRRAMLQQYPDRSRAPAANPAFSAVSLPSASFASWEASPVISAYSLNNGAQSRTSTPAVVPQSPTIDGPLEPPSPTPSVLFSKQEHLSSSPPSPVETTVFQTGRIQVVGFSKRRTAYLYRVSNNAPGTLQSGCLSPTTSISDALLVRVASSDQLECISLLNSDEGDWLGVKWKATKRTIGPNASGMCALAPLRGVESATMESELSSDLWKGRTRIRLWKISDNNELFTIWVSDDGVDIPLQFSLNRWVFPPIIGLSSRPPKKGLQPLRLLFEPV